MHLIRYSLGNKMVRHGDSLQKSERYGGCRMRLVLNHGDARKIHFSANVLDMSKVKIEEWWSVPYLRLGY
jgi:hypothetical protein